MNFETLYRMSEVDFADWTIPLSLKELMHIKTLLKTQIVNVNYDSSRVRRRIKHTEFLIKMAKGRDD